MLHGRGRIPMTMQRYVAARLPLTLSPTVQGPAGALEHLEGLEGLEILEHLEHLEHLGPPEKPEYPEMQKSLPHGVCGRDFR